MITGVDTSNHNHARGPIDFAAVKASGRAFVVLKASEGVGFKDPYLDADRKAAHAAGLIVLLYHFGRGGDPAAEAAWFLRCVGSLQVGEGVVLDDEVPGVTPAWVQAWCDAVAAKTTVKALVYMNQAARDAGDWRAVGAADGLWLAKYDGTTTLPAGGTFGGTAMKQYSDAGTVAGIVGAVDLDVFYGTDQQLLAYGLQGGPDMLLTDTLTYRGGTATATVAEALGRACDVYDALFNGGTSTPGGRSLDDLIGEIQRRLRGSDPNVDELQQILMQVQALRSAPAPAQVVTLDDSSVAQLVTGLAGSPAFVSALAVALDAQFAKRFQAP